MNVAKFKLIGIADDVTTCECCGKKNLKRTVALAQLDAEGGPTGDVVHYGCDCAAVALGRSKRKGDRKAADVVWADAIVEQRRDAARQFGRALGEALRPVVEKLVEDDVTILYRDGPYHHVQWGREYRYGVVAAGFPFTVDAPADLPQEHAKGLAVSLFLCKVVGACVERAGVYDQYEAFNAAQRVARGEP